jgi:hypothetical protein
VNLEQSAELLRAAPILALFFELKFMLTLESFGETLSSAMNKVCLCHRDEGELNELESASGG